MNGRLYWDYTLTKSIITQQVTHSGLYSFEAWGARGGGSITCEGAYSKSMHYLDNGSTIYILVGGSGYQSTSGGYDCSGGGGGTFIATGSSLLSSTPICVAGGGGGANFYRPNGATKQNTCYGQSEKLGGNPGIGYGSIGYGGKGSLSSGGGGFYGNGLLGSYGTPGNGFIYGGGETLTGSYSSAYGGFGGGSSTHGECGGGPGGGGYTGGSASTNNHDGVWGGGGGSFSLDNITIAGYQTMPTTLINSQSTMVGNNADGFARIILLNDPNPSPSNCINICTNQCSILPRHLFLSYFWIVFIISNEKTFLNFHMTIDL